MQVGAVDILAMLRSFLGKGQSINKVTVFPSDFGLQKMAEEAKFGPQGLFGNSRLAPQPAGSKSDAAALRVQKRKFAMSKAERAAILETLNEQESEEEEDEEEGGEAASLSSGFSNRRGKVSKVA